MKNKFFNILSLTFIVGALLTSCETVDDETIEKTGKPTLTVENTSITVTEGETATFNLRIDYPIATKVDVRIDILDADGNPIPTTIPDGDPRSGNGYLPLDLDDIEVPYTTWFESGWFAYGYLGGSGYVATFDPYLEEMQININTKADMFLMEDTETIQLHLSATSEMAAAIDEVVTLTIENYESEEVGLGLEWGATDANFDPCSMDMDIFLDDFSAYLFTGNCPEFLINPQDPNIEATSVLADGTYTVVADLWDKGDASSVSPVFDIPLTVRIFKPGIFSTTIEYADLYDSSHGDSSNDGAGEETVATIEVVNGKYTVFDRDGNLIAQE